MDTQTRPPLPLILHNPHPHHAEYTSPFCRSPDHITTSHTLTLHNPLVSLLTQHVLTVVDLTPFYPAAIKPSFLTAIQTHYINTYKDRFFIDPPPFFTTFAALEAVYSLPLSVWAVRAILRGMSATTLPLLCSTRCLVWSGMVWKREI
jgi:EXPERA (EXPanded EBP superfamily)